MEKMCVELHFKHFQEKWPLGYNERVWKDRINELIGEGEEFETTITEIDIKVCMGRNATCKHVK